jgi:hypothetical protein
LHDQRARDAHPLAHPPRAARVAGREIGEADELEHVTHALDPLLAAELRAAQTEGYVVGDVEPGERCVLLEHDADSVRCFAGDRPAFELDRAFGCRREARDQLEQRRLAAAGRADNREELAAPELEIERPQRVQRRALLAAGKLY